VAAALDHLRRRFSRLATAATAIAAAAAATAAEISAAVAALTTAVVAAAAEISATGAGGTIIILVEGVDPIGEAAAEIETFREIPFVKKSDGKIPVRPHLSVCTAYFPQLLSYTLVQIITYYMRLSSPYFSYVK
jgi:hypothetical protein